MTRMRWLALAAVLAVVAAACGTTAETTTTTAGQTTTSTTAAPTTTGTTMAEFQGIGFSAPSCDYGGKIRSVEATGQYEVTFTLCSPTPAFQQIVAFTPFGIQPEEHLEATGGAPLDNPIGTGPFVLDAWTRGSDITFSANADYWGDAPAFNTLVFRWAAESATRLVDLQAGTVDMITNLATNDIATVEADPNLQLLPVRNPNVFYLGMANTLAPFDNPDVRRAIGMGIDRQAIVDNFYPAGSEVASHFTPCSLENGCEGDAWYEYDPDTAAQMVEDAGAAGAEVVIYYRNVFRVYLPEPAAVAQEIAQQLTDNLGLNASVQEMESAAFIEAATVNVELPIYLLGWGADYPHITNFLDFHFGGDNPQFGTPDPSYVDPIREASAIADPAEAAPLYADANNALREVVPMVPIAHGSAVSASLATVEGADPWPVFGAPQFELMNPGKDTLVFMQNNEPISLYCADESDGESLAACQQVLEPLLEYDLEGNVVPALATGCESNFDGTEWTCTLREGVTFHDGSSFDANDVVTNWAVWMVPAHELHVGNTGAFFYPSYLWGGLIGE